MTNLQRIRKNRGLTQKQLADKSGVSLKMIQKYETGVKNINHARVLTVLCLGYALDTKMFMLMEEDDEVKELAQRL